jgi:DNA-binding response OmpR family regulator
VRVLVAEDEPRVADAIARGLRRHFSAVDVAPDGSDALYKARVYPYDVIVLDRDLPEMHGDDVCRVLSQEQPETKVLMLTAARGLDDGRDLGLSPKEFGVLEVLLAADGAAVSSEELLARVWDEHTDPFSNTVRMTVMTLRRKLGDPPVVQTVTGSGYRV